MCVYTEPLFDAALQHQMRPSRFLNLNYKRKITIEKYEELRNEAKEMLMVFTSGALFFSYYYFLGGEGRRSQEGTTNSRCRSSVLRSGEWHRDGIGRTWQ